MSSALPERERRLEEAVAEYLRALETGARPDAEEFVRRYPDLADDLRAFIGDHDAIDRAAGPLREAAPPLPLPYRFGDYELQEEIARGGMGVVYRARQLRANRDVALKMILAGRLASPDDVERFRTEAEAAASLEHPHIVPIYEVGEHEGQHFFSMKLIEGGDLEERLSGFPKDLKGAAELMATVARAVNHAHQRGFLHRDLKPANILLDAEGRPHVTDFGLAMRVDGANRRTTSGTLMGTAAYMAPERVKGDGGPPTTASDVWSLGAILYEMLTGRVPFAGATPLSTLRQVVEREPDSPRARNPAIDRDLESICLKCLEKEPDRRYGSAFGLARDLERWLAGQPVEARPVRGAGRAWRWCRRNPAIASLTLVAAALFILAGLAVAVLMGRRAEIIETNKHLARGAAERFRQQFREWAEWVSASAEDPEFLNLVRSEDWDGLNEHLVKVHRRYDIPSKELMRPGRDEPSSFPFDSWHFHQPDGVMRARFRITDRIGQEFSWRDYAIGARRHTGRKGIESVHISTIYVSEAGKGINKFALSAPVHAEDGTTVLGALMASITTDPDLGLLFIHDERRKAALVAPEDPSRRSPDPPVRPRNLIVMHPAISRAENAVPIESPLLRPADRPPCTLELAPPEAPGVWGVEDSYGDPLGAKNPDYAGPWLAVSAPVGNTGYAVIIQQRDPSNPFLWAATGILAVILAGALAAYSVRRRSRQAS